MISYFTTWHLVFSYFPSVDPSSTFCGMHSAEELNYHAWEAPKCFQSSILITGVPPNTKDANTKSCLRTFSTRSLHPLRSAAVDDIMHVFSTVTTLRTSCLPRFKCWPKFVWSIFLPCSKNMIARHFRDAMPCFVHAFDTHEWRPSTAADNC